MTLVARSCPTCRSIGAPSGGCQDMWHIEVRDPTPLRQGFHAGSGWYFRRGIDGSVSIYAADSDEVVLDSHTWASVVASVSVRGEGHETFHAALDLHGEPEPAD